MAEPAVSRRIRLGPFELDPRSGELWNNGSHQTLPEQPLALLRALLAHPGELVTRDEFRKELWPEDTFVDFEHGLNAAVKRLRDTLGDSADQPKFIETIPKRGYRLIAPVTDPHVGSHHVIEFPPPAPSPEPAPPVVSRLRWLAGRRGWRVAVLGAVFVGIALGVTVRSRRTHDDNVPTLPRNLTRLTFGPGLDTDPTWSPDGKYIAYASDRAGNMDIWVQAVAGGEPRQLTHSPAVDDQPTWSPDGSDLIAFHSERDGGGLFAVPAQGGPERRLTTFGVHPRWAPDGSRLLFASDRSRNLSGLFTGLFTVGLGGAPPHQVEGLPADLPILSWNWHPDGRRISVIGVGPEHFVLVLAPPSGGLTFSSELTGLQCDYADWSGFESNQFEWAPDGAAVYLGCARDLTMDIWRVRIDPQTLKVLASDRMTTSTGQSLPITLSPDATRVAFTARSMLQRVWVFSLDVATGRVIGEGHPVTDAGYYVRESALSPDGQRLAYHYSRPGTPVDQIGLTDLGSGATQTVLANVPGLAFPVWSPDGRKLAYLWGRDTSSGYEQGIVLSQPDGSQSESITTPRRNNKASDETLWSWTPDGTTLLGSKWTGEDWALVAWSLAAAPRAESAARIVAMDKRYRLWQSRVSSNGRWLVFEAEPVDDPASCMIEVVRADAERSSERNWTKITGAGSYAAKPRWSPNGELVYFVRPGGMFWNLWAVHFDQRSGKVAGVPFQVTHFDNAKLQLSPWVIFAEVGVSADRLTLTMTERRGSIWMVDNVDR